MKSPRDLGQSTEKGEVIKTLLLLFCCGLLVLIGSIAANAQSVQTDYDRSFNLAKLKSYSFLKQTRKPGDPLAASSMNDYRIYNALDSQLKANGFANSTSGQPDFLIAYFVTAQKGLDIQDNRFGLLQRRGSINVGQVTEGTLVVVFVDSSTQREVWRGFMSGTINPKHLDEDVYKGVAKLVEKFVKNQAGKR